MSFGASVLRSFKEIWENGVESSTRRQMYLNLIRVLGVLNMNGSALKG